MTANDLARLLHANLNLFGRAQVKAAYKLDFFPIDLDGSAEALVNLTRYWLGLFSHRRGDDLWKGMLQVRLEDSPTMRPHSRRLVQTRLRRQPQEE